MCFILLCRSYGNLGTTIKIAAPRLRATGRPRPVSPDYIRLVVQNLVVPACAFEQSEVKFLGLINGTQPLSNKVGATQEFPKQTTEKQLRQFLGVLERPVPWRIKKRRRSHTKTGSLGLGCHFELQDKQFESYLFTQVNRVIGTTKVDAISSRSQWND